MQDAGKAVGAADLPAGAGQAPFSTPLINPHVRCRIAGAGRSRRGAADPLSLRGLASRPGIATGGGCS